MPFWVMRDQVTGLVRDEDPEDIKDQYKVEQTRRGKQESIKSRKSKSRLERLIQNGVLNASLSQVTGSIKDVL